MAVSQQTAALDAVHPAASTSARSSAESVTETVDPAALAFGEVIFDYYNNRSFPAITNLLIARQQGILSERDAYAEMLLGDLYTSFGLTENAEKLFSRLVNQDILTRIRNETWFHAAELNYKQSRYDEAARILENRVQNLPPDMEKSRLIMLGNIYVQRGELLKAANLLSTVAIDDVLGAYALYNAGVALVRAGDLSQGIPLLKRVRDLPPGDDETNALKDRAALAIGFVWLQKENYGESRESLLTVRSSGPFSNQAMLGLGYANFQRGDFRRSLPPWLELLKRNTSDVTVQEALMLAPRAYEELNAQAQALAGYKQAADTLRNELKKVERAIVRVRESSWLDSLGSESETIESNASLVSLGSIGASTATRTPEAPYLYSLFASKEFSEEFTAYLELKQVELVIDRWQEQIPMYQDLLAKHREQLPSLKSKLDALTSTVGGDIQTMQTQLAMLEDRATVAIRNGDIEHTAHVKDLLRLETARALKALPNLSETQQERTRRLEGLALWDIAHNAPMQQEQTLQDIAQLKKDLDQAVMHFQSLSRLRDDIAIRMSTDFDHHFTRATERLSGLKLEASGRLRQQTIVLQNKALTVLTDMRRNIGAQLAEAHLSIARLHDPAGGMKKGSQ